MPVWFSALAILGGVGAVGNGLGFLTAGIAKLRARDTFAGVVANYRLLPGSLVQPMAAMLPLAEIAVGALLIAGVGAAALPAAALLLLFAGAMAVNIGRGRSHIDCGCGRSELRQPLSRMLVIRNLVLAALVLPSFWALPPAGSAAWMLAMAGGVALHLLTVLANMLAALAAMPLAASMLPSERNGR
ncbi:MAG: MauE/DoxX family redox-associated membrane protein [Novosphingobium meiothermophilum]